ncbi:MAG: hypothetical protein V1790_01850 [Planctomycetota bacterium]
MATCGNTRHGWKLLVQQRNLPTMPILQWCRKCGAIRRTWFPVRGPVVRRVTFRYPKGN